MNMQTSYENILKPGNIGKLKLKNRIIFNAADTYYATVDGQVTQKIIDYYVRRAQGGAGLVVVASTAACTKIDTIDPYMPGLRVDDNAYIPMLYELTEAVHRKDGKISILVSAGGGTESLGFPYDRGLEGVIDIENIGPSEKASRMAKRRVRRLSIEEVEKIIQVYGLAARRVRTAGFDAVHIHAWGGHLIANFLSPNYNTRDDKYGKGFEGRSRFLLELIESCRRNVGSDFPIIVKISVDEFVPDGNHLEDSIKIAKRLEESGVNAIDAGAGTHEVIQYIIPPVYFPNGVLVHLASALKKEVKIPIIAGAKLSEPDLAESVIREGKADFIAIVRGMLADPYWVSKIENGQANEIRKCVTCNCCIGNIQRNQPIRCALNAITGREGEFTEVPPIAPISRKVVIVGAGPAGVEAARITAQRGHHVKLFEKMDDLGGQLHLAAKPPFKEVLLNIVQYQKSQLPKLGNLEIFLNKEVKAKDVMVEKPDVVILATGASPLIPRIDGVNNPNVVSGWNVLEGKLKVKGKILIAGGGLVGVELADELSEKGMDITIVEMLDRIVPDEELITRRILTSRLRQKSVKVLTRHKIERFVENGAITIDKDNKEILIPADYIILALGSIKYNPLEKDLKNHIPYCYVIGDAKDPRKIMDAVHEGFLTGHQI